MGNGIEIAHGYCTEFSVFHTESEPPVCLLLEYNRVCSMGSSWFNPFWIEHLGHFILLELVRFVSSSIRCELDWSCVFWRQFHPILGPLNSIQVVMPHAFQLGQQFYKFCAIMCVIIPNVYLDLSLLFIVMILAFSTRLCGWSLASWLFKGLDNTEFKEFLSTINYGVSLSK